MTRLQRLCTGKQLLGSKGNVTLFSGSEQHFLYLWIYFTNIKLGIYHLKNVDARKPNITFLKGKNKLWFI